MDLSTPKDLRRRVKTQLSANARDDMCTSTAPTTNHPNDDRNSPPFSPIVTVSSLDDENDIYSSNPIPITTQPRLPTPTLDRHHSYHLDNNNNNAHDGTFPHLVGPSLYQTSSHHHYQPINQQEQHDYQQDQHDYQQDQQHLDDNNQFQFDSDMIPPQLLHNNNQNNYHNNTLGLNNNNDNNQADFIDSISDRFHSIESTNNYPLISLLIKKFYNFSIITTICLFCYCCFLAIVQDKLIYLYPTYNVNYSYMLLSRYNSHPLKDIQAASSKQQRLQQQQQYLQQQQHQQQHSHPTHPQINTILSSNLRPIIPIVYSLPAIFPKSIQQPEYSYWGTPTAQHATTSPYLDLSTNTTLSSSSPPSNSASSWWDYIPLPTLSLPLPPTEYDYTSQPQYHVTDINLLLSLLNNKKDKNLFYQSLPEITVINPKTKQFEQSQYDMTLFYLPPKDNAIPTNLVILSGGNGMTGLDFIPFLDRLEHTQQQESFNISSAAAKTAYVLIDFPGYGLNRGIATPSVTQGNLSTALQVVKHYIGTRLRYQYGFSTTVTSTSTSSSASSPTTNPTNNNSFATNVSTTTKIDTDTSSFKSANIHSRVISNQIAPFVLNVHFLGFSLGSSASISGAISLQHEQIFHLHQLIKLRKDQHQLNDKNNQNKPTPQQINNSNANLPIIELRPASLTLDSPFNSMQSLVSQLLQLPQSIIYYLLQHNYDNQMGLKQLYDNQQHIIQLSSILQQASSSATTLNYSFTATSPSSNNVLIPTQPPPYQHIPITFIHSTDDDIINYSNCQELFLSLVNLDQLSTKSIIKTHQLDTALKLIVSNPTDDKNDPQIDPDVDSVFNKLGIDQLLSDPTNTIQQTPLDLITPLPAFFSTVPIHQFTYMYGSIPNSNQQQSTLLSHSSSSTSPPNSSTSPPSNVKTNYYPKLTLLTLTGASHNDAFSDAYGLVPYKALMNSLVRSSYHPPNGYFNPNL